MTRRKCNHGSQYKRIYGRQVGCSECRREGRLRRYKDNPRKYLDDTKNWKDRIRARVVEVLGEECACCGSNLDLQIDHIKPVLKNRGGVHTFWREILENPEEFQMLCRRCNRWKDIGPCCPCSWWDSVSPDWREELVKREEELSHGKE